MPRRRQRIPHKHAQHISGDFKVAAQIHHSEYAAASQQWALVTNKENIIYTNLRLTTPHYDKAMFYILTVKLFNKVTR